MVKQGDQFPVTFTVNHDLTGATVRLLVRHLTRTGDLEELPHTVTDAATGTITHNLDGTWALGRHYIELEITQAGEIRTAPTDGYYVIRIEPDLDEH
ncbi:hypothetical protein [Microbacterium sp. WCS2018Hpa-9]|uniref:hypothetical protein n=1 Tax=Microbacterium sp. WCS2018Hpa-9 TaxID=3073635 RepID=UPI00288AAC8B|nr:hypothetical protein [Microbacterium sp. WCS2018Hpa-9]